MKQFKTFFISTSIIIITSCAPSYIPNVANTPLLSNKGEFQASVNTGISGFDPQLAYAVSDHIGIMFNGSFADRTTDSTNNFHKHNFMEVGTGYYTKLGGNGRFETYMGGGFGKVSSLNESGFGTFTTEANNIRFFIQPAIGTTSKIFDGSFATRLAFVNMNNEFISSTGVFIEPIFTAKLGYKYIKTVFQIGFSIPLNPGKINYEYEPFLFSIGLQANIGKLWDK